MAVRLFGTLALLLVAGTAILGGSSALSEPAEDGHGGSVGVTHGIIFGVDPDTGRQRGAADLAEAASLVPFDLHIFDVERIQPALPFLAATMLFSPEDGPSERDIIRLYFGRYPGPNLRLAESPQPFTMGGLAEPIVVQGVDGVIQRADDVPTPFTSILWRSGGMTYLAQSVLDEDWALEDLLALLDTIT